jgi:type IV secretory pathway VirB10-like protein
VNPKDKPETGAASGAQPIEAPAGIDLHPKPPKAVRLSKMAGLAFVVVGLGLLAAFAYGGYRRQQREQVAAREAGLPSSVAPATTAGNEFIQAIPVKDPPTAQKTTPGQLQPPGTYTGAAPPPNQVVEQAPCGWDARTGQPYRFNPQTGVPCTPPLQQDRVVVRQAPPAQYASTPPQPTPEEQRIAAAYQREREAMTAPMGIRSGNGSSGLSFPTGANRSEDLAQLAALRKALTGPNADGSTVAAKALIASGGGSDNDYDGQNMQTRKEAFLVSARSQKTDDYLRSTRSAPLGTYEIKAGWEIPAVLEQSLNSDLPGDLKALVMSNVYDTATGRYLLIPQGSRLIGRYDSRVSYGQDGVQVVWDRVMFPDASPVDINGMVGLDSHGNAGLRDKVDRHYKRLVGFAAMTSMFSAAFDLSQRQTYGSGLAYPSIGDTASASVGRELSQTGAMITRRNLNVQPTIKVPVGYKFTVRVNRDILFDAPYQPMQADPQPLVPRDRQLRRRSAFTTAADQQR